MDTYQAGPDVSVISDCHEVPGIGYIPVNAFVLHAREPVVVDTGLGLPDRDFIRALGSVLDPADVRWIWLTHPDRDHTGGIFSLLDAAPQARVITTFIGVGLMSLEHPLPLHRVFLLNPGQQLDVGDRTLHAFRPPLYDNPATVGFYDDRSGACFSSDCFGAPMPTAELATCPDVRAVDAGELRAAQLLWATVDSPWVHSVSTASYLRSVRSLESLSARTLLSSHLPPAVGIQSQLLDMLAAAPGADAFTGPDQRALTELLASFEPKPEAIVSSAGSPGAVSAPSAERAP